MNLIVGTKSAAPAMAIRRTSEWSFVIATITVTLVLASLPYVYAYATAPTDKQFMGVILDVPDHVQYFSWMHELSTANLASNKLTPEANSPIFFNLLWWGMGRLGKLLDADYAVMFQMLRFIAGGLFLCLLYRVCSWFFEDRTKRRIAFLVATFGSGFGWLLVVLKYSLTKGQLLYPLDLYIAEGNTFLCLIGYPHFIAAALYIFVFDLFLRGEAKGELRYSVIAGLIAFFLGWQHAYDLITVYAVLLAYAALRVLRDRALSRYLVIGIVTIGLLSCWPALYSAAITSADPLWKAVLAQFSNAGVYTPNPLHLPILLGPAFVLAVITLLVARPWRLKAVSNNELFIRGWFLASFVLIYLPVDYQIHLLNGWQVPIAILATIGMFRYVIPMIQAFADRWHRQLRQMQIEHVAAAILVLIILPTNVYLWVWRFVDLSRHAYPYYLSREEVAGLNWLEANSGPDAVVMSDLTLGQYIPMLTGSHAFLAHWAETIRYFEKTQLVQEFYASGTFKLRREAILRQYHVDYVLCGPDESQIGGCEFANAPFLVPAYSTPKMTIYRVRLL